MNDMLHMARHQWAAAQPGRHGTLTTAYRWIACALIVAAFPFANAADSAGAEAADIAPTTFQEASAYLEKSLENPAYDTYARGFGKFFPFMQIPKRRHCEKLSKTGKVSLIFLIGADGKVFAAFSESKVPKMAECIRLSYIGVVTSPPPFSPLPMSVIYGKD